MSFLEKVAVCTGAFQAERILICRVNKYPVSLNMTVTGELPGLRDFLHFFQLLNIPSIDSNS